MQYLAGRLGRKLNLNKVFFIALSLLNINQMIVLLSGIMRLRGIFRWHFLIITVFILILFKKDSFQKIPGLMRVLIFSGLFSFLILETLPGNFPGFFHLPLRRVIAIFQLSAILFIAFNAEEAGKRAGKRIVLISGVITLIFAAMCFADYRASVKIFECKRPGLYKFLSNVPVGAIIAGHPYALDAVPFFAQREVFVCNELSFVFSKMWTGWKKQRTYEIFNVLYSASSDKLLNFCKKYAAEDMYLVVDNEYYCPQYLQGQELYFVPFNAYLKDITKTKKFFLMSIDDKFKVYEDENVFVIHCRDFARGFPEEHN